MKLILALLVLVPLAFAIEERFVLDTIGHLFDLPELSSLVRRIFQTVGSNGTEAACEAECHQIVHIDVLDSGCPLVCKSFQALVRLFHIG